VLEREFVGVGEGVCGCWRGSLWVLKREFVGVGEGVCGCWRGSIWVFQEREFVATEAVQTCILQPHRMVENEL